MEKLNGENVRSDFLNHFKWQRVNIIVKIIMASNCQLNNFFIQPPAFYKNSQNNTKYEFKSLVVYRFILPVLFFFFFCFAYLSLASVFIVSLQFFNYTHGN